jgi:TM2 domain-containing membrane protein YozV
MEANTNPQYATAPQAAAPAQYRMAPKSMAVAYLLWFFLGWLGIHRFYLGRTGTGVAQLLMGLIGGVLTLILIGWFVLAAEGIWLLVDIFLIPAMTREENIKRGYAG